MSEAAASKANEAVISEDLHVNQRLMSDIGTMRSVIVAML